MTAASGVENGREKHPAGTVSGTYQNCNYESGKIRSRNRQLRVRETHK